MIFDMRTYTCKPGTVPAHLKLYEDAADRSKRRAAMQADPDWQSFLKMSAEAGYLLSQQNQILQSASFFNFSR
jgi:hypothetical protein